MSSGSAPALTYNNKMKHVFLCWTVFATTVTDMQPMGKESNLLAELRVGRK